MILSFLKTLSTSVRKVYRACKAGPLRQGTKTKFSIFYRNWKKGPSVQTQINRRNTLGFFRKTNVFRKLKGGYGKMKRLLGASSNFCNVKVQANIMDSFHVTGYMLVIVKFPNRNRLISTPRLNRLLYLHLVPIT